MAGWVAPASAVRHGRPPPWNRAPARLAALVAAGPRALLAVGPGPGVGAVLRGGGSAGVIGVPELAFSRARRGEAVGRVVVTRDSLAARVFLAACVSLTARRDLAEALAHPREVLAGRRGVLALGALSPGLDHLVGGLLDAGVVVAGPRDGIGHWLLLRVVSAEAARRSMASARDAQVSGR